MDSEKRTALETEVAEVIGVLFDALSEERLDEGGSLAVSEGIGCYAQQVERVGLAAEAAGFGALRELCTLFERMVTDLGTRGGALTESERMLLEEWPTLVIGYMEAPDEPETHEALLAHLRNPEWSMPLAAADAERLRARLAPSATSLAEAETVSASEDLAAAVSAAVEEIPGATLEVVEPVLEPLLEPAAVGQEDLSSKALETEEPTLESATEIEPDFLAAAEEDQEPEPDFPAVTPKWETRVVAQAVETAAATTAGEPDADVIPRLNADGEEKPVLELGAVLPAAGAALNEEYANAQAPEESVESVAEAAPTAEAFATVPVAEADETTLARSLAAIDDIIAPAVPEPAALAEAETPVGTVEEEVLRLLDVSLDGPDAGSALAGDAELPRGGLLGYAAQVERLSLAADSVGWVGIQNLCALLGEALRDLASRQHPVDDTHKALLEQWPALLMAHLQAPADPATGQALLDHLQHPAWRITLTPPERNLLGEMLGLPAEDETALTAVVIEQASLAPALEPPSPASSEAAPVAVEEAPEDEVAPVALHAVDAEESGAAEGDLPPAELIEILVAEVTQLRESTTETLERLSAEHGDHQTRQDTITSYAEELERLADAAEAVGLTGLHHVCAHIDANLLSLAARERPLSASEHDMLARWPGLTLNYLQALHDPAPRRRLVSYLQDGPWPTPLSQEDAAELSTLLGAPTPTPAAMVEVEARPQQAQPEHVSLQVPADGNPELLESLLQELPGQTADFSAAVQRIVDGEGTLRDVDVAQRIAHTLKGAGNTVGVRGIANLTHHMEDILRALTKHQTLPNRPLAESLMSAADCLESMSEALLGQGDPPAQAQAVLQDILDWANRIDREGVPSGDEALAARQAPAEEEQPIATAVKPAAEPVAAVPMLRVPATLVDDLLRLVGESIILTGQVQEQARKALNHTRAAQTQNAVFQQLTADLEQLVEIRGMTMPSLAPAVRDRGDFDPLELEQYDELNTLTHRLLEVSTDARELGQNIRDDLTVLDNLMVDQGRLHRQSQEAVLRTRMVPVKTIVPRLQRSVRQTCRLTDKDVELRVSGDETLMDSNVLTDMTDPLMHVLRNAVDHGIEPPETRRAKGKRPTGRIDLAFVREGNTIVVRCQDDGAGLDLPVIRRIAEERRLVRPDETLSDDELSRLILTPGFSTRAVATQTSGRGVGLDVVYTSLQAIKGSFHVSSKAGQGCLIELRLPVTLISTHALLVRVQRQVYAISNRGVEQILYAGGGEIRHLGPTTVYQLGDDIYELVFIEELLNLPHDRRAHGREVRSLLLVRDEAGTTRAVLVQEILDSRDLVVKNMGRYVPRLRGVVGATILGDGGVVPVLDLPDLLRVPSRTMTAVAGPRGHEPALETAAPQRRVALVVDDSLSARRSLAQFVEDAGFEVRTARDGLEAAAIIDNKRPDLLLVDLEMPRMNGLELTSHVRARETTRDLPVIMITSRSTAKHIQEAKAAGVNFYMTKPFVEEELLGNIQAALRAH